jgi:hypothetical protein
LIIVQITGVTMRTWASDDSMPPSTGVAIGFATSEPVSVDHRMGSNPAITVETVISLGRRRRTAPSIAASRMLSRVSAPATAFLCKASSR